METNGELEPERPMAKRKGKQIRTWVAIILTIIVLVIVLQNWQHLSITILFWNFQVRGFILLPFIFLVGVVVGYIVRRQTVNRSARRSDKLTP